MTGRRKFRRCLIWTFWAVSYTHLGADNRRIEHVRDVEVDEAITIRISDGRLTAKVTEREEL